MLQSVPVQKDVKHQRFAKSNEGQNETCILEGVARYERKGINKYPDFLQKVQRTFFYSTVNPIHSCIVEDWLYETDSHLVCRNIRSTTLNARIRKKLQINANAGFFIWRHGPYRTVRICIANVGSQTTAGS